MDNMNSTYECEICYGINHAKHFHCQYCGTTPKHYSFTGQTIRAVKSIENISLYYINVVVAFGAIRQVSNRTIKRVARTVPADYYASRD